MEALLKPLLEAGGTIGLAIGFGVLVYMISKSHSMNVENMAQKFSDTMDKVSKEIGDNVKKNTEVTSKLADNFDRFLLLSQQRKRK